MGLEADLRSTTRFERLLHVLSCESTQALSMDDAGGDSAVFWSDHQSAGRGRQGRSWHDAPGHDIAVTLRLTDLALESPTLLAAAIPVAVVRAVADDVPSIEIKWPNDLLLHGRKLCGVLIDTSGQPPHTFHVGIGINVNRSSFPAELLDQSTSLALATGREFDRQAVLLRLAREVTTVADQLQAGSFESIVEDFQTRLGLTGKPVHAAAGGQSYTGTLTHIDLHHATLDHQTDIPLAHIQTIKPVS